MGRVWVTAALCTPMAHADKRCRSRQDRSPHSQDRSVPVPSPLPLAEPALPESPEAGCPATASCTA